MQFGIHVDTLGSDKVTITSRLKWADSPFFWISFLFCHFIQSLIEALGEEESDILDAIDDALMHIGNSNASPLIKPYLDSFSKQERKIAFEYREAGLLTTKHLSADTLGKNEMHFRHQPHTFPNQQRQPQNHHLAPCTK